MVEKRLVFQHTVEGLFVRSFASAVTPEVRARLKALGLDLDAVPPAIDAHIYFEAYVALREAVHPGLPADEADLSMGIRFIDGYFETVIGQLTKMMMKVLPVETHIERSSRNFESAVNFVKCQPAKIGVRQYRIAISDFALSPWFTVGILRRMFVLAGVKRSEVKLEEQRGRTYSLLVSWD